MSRSEAGIRLDAIRNLHGIESVGDMCGKGIGFAVRWLLEEAGRMDRELEVVHSTLVRLYDAGNAECRTEIQKCRRKIALDKQRGG